jgi:stearoyl-CoA desaturase (delta-9 desaturase)
LTLIPLSHLGAPWSIILAVVFALMLAQFSFFLTTIYLHRALAHKALTLSTPTATACRVLTWVTTGIRPRHWVAVHRKHHAFTDEEGDPHSPFLFGYPAVQFGNVTLYRRAARDDAIVARYARDLPRDRWDRWVFDHALAGLAIGIAILVLLIGWQLGLLASLVYTAIYLLGGGAINAVGHWWGKRPHDNLATNNQWLAWVVAGEGLHNNHHAATTSARMAAGKGEVDPAWVLIRLMVKLRLATLRSSRFQGNATGSPLAGTSELVGQEQ